MLLGEIENYNFYPILEELLEGKTLSKMFEVNIADRLQRLVDQGVNPFLPYDQNGWNLYVL